MLLSPLGPLEREVELEGRAGIEGEEVGGAVRCREECRRGDGESMAFWSVPDERRQGERREGRGRELTLKSGCMRHPWGSKTALSSFSGLSSRSDIL